MSANGERAVEALGRRWTLLFDFNAMCRVEEAYDRPFLEVVQRLFPQVAPEDMADPVKVAQAAMAVRFTDVRAVLQHALIEKHPEATGDLAGKIIQEIGMQEAVQLVGWAVKSAIGAEEAEDTENPPKAAVKRRKGLTGQSCSRSGSRRGSRRAGSGNRRRPRSRRCFAESKRPASAITNAMWPWRTPRQASRAPTS